MNVMNERLVAETLRGKVPIRCVVEGARYAWWVLCPWCGYAYMLTVGERDALKSFCGSCKNEMLLIQWSKEQGVYKYNPCVTASASRCDIGDDGHMTWEEYQNTRFKK